MMAASVVPATSRVILRASFVVAGVVALVLGMIGFPRLPAVPPGAATPENLYYTLQLFLLDSSPLQTAVRLPWELEVARFLAPATTTLGLLLVGQAFFDAAINLVRVRLSSDHTVVCGRGTPALLVARSVSTEKRRCLLVEVGADPSAWQRFPQARAGRGLVLRVGGDPRDDGVLRAARVHTAREVVVVMGDDSENADVALAVRRAGGPDGRARCFVQMRSPQLAEALVGRDLSTGTTNPLEFFDPAEAAARRLLDEYLPEAEGPEDRPVVVLGSGALVDAVAAALRRRAGQGRAPKRTDVLDLDAVDDVAGLDPRLVLVSSGDTGADVRVGLTVGRAMRDRPVEILVALGTNVSLGEVATGGHGATASPIGLARVRMVADGRDVLDVRTLREGVFDDLARETHDAYLRNARAKGRPDSPSRRPWKELDDELRESNLHQARSFGARLREINCSVVPDEDADRAEPDFVFSREELEFLAEKEHERWCVERRRTRPLDHDGKPDPDLVCWDQLSPDAKAKDREAIEAIPQTLRRAGFRIVRVGALRRNGR